MKPGTRLGPYEVVGPIGAGGPPPLALALMRELRRGLAEADPRGRA
jgi:hypothetical protein